jgi:ribosomal protein S10
MATLEALAVTLDMQVDGTTQSIDTSTGALVVLGGAAVQKDFFVGGNFHVTGGEGASDSSLVIDANAPETSYNVQKGNMVFNLYEGGQNIIHGLGSTTTDSSFSVTDFNYNPLFNVRADGYTTLTLDMKINGTTQSTDTSTGSLVVLGGTAVQKNLNVGGDFDVDGNASVGSLDVAGPTVLSETTISSLVVTGDATIASLVIESTTIEALSVTDFTATNASVDSLVVSTSSLLAAASASSLNVSGSTVLAAASASSLDVSGPTVLTNASASSLDVSGSTVLAAASSSSLNVSGSTVLAEASASSLDVSGPTVLAAASASSLDVSGSTVLAAASASSLNVSGPTVLTNTSSSSLNVSGSTVLTNTSSSSLNVSGSTVLANASASSLSVSGSTVLAGVSATSLSISGPLSATDTTLSSLVVTGQTSLNSLTVVSSTMGGLTVTGAVYGDSFNATSDATLKTNIEHLSGSLEQLKRIECYQYNWRDQSMGEDIQYGVLAQQLEEAGLGHLVAKGSHKSVNYLGLIPILIEAVKELSDKLEMKKDLF